MEVTASKYVEKDVSNDPHMTSLGLSHQKGVTYETGSFKSGIG